MTASLLITTMLLAAAALQGTDAARNDYGKCLRKLTIEQLKADKPVEEFVAAMATACAREEAAFRAAVIAAARADRIPAAEAERDAKEQIADYQDNFRLKYADFKESGTMPGN